jgi:hypothetical protein
MRLKLHRYCTQLAALATALLLAACASAPPAPEPTRLQLQLTPASLGTSISLQQHLKVERNGRSDELDTVLEIDPEQLNLVGLAFGQRVMTLQYDGKQLTTWRHLMLPKQVQGEDVLRDVQLTLWPAAAIRSALPTGWELQETSDASQRVMTRTLLQDHEVVTQIDYPDRKPWGGSVILTSLRYHYKLTILSVVTGP